jgi:aminocarboxymuconate-semialdehyde decarboxylase
LVDIGPVDRSPRLGADRIVARVEAGIPNAPMIDVQTHYIPAAAARLLDDAGSRPLHGLPGDGRVRALMTSLDERLRAMDQAGVEASALSFAPIGPIEDRALHTAVSRAANDGLIHACEAYPDRFVMSASLPLPDAGAALTELERIVDAAPLRALTIVADTTCYCPDEIGLEPLIARAGEAGLPILLHPTAGAADLSPAFDAFGLASGMHAMVSHALVAARLIQSGLLDRCDGLELILTHLGGVLPFLIERLDSRHKGPSRFAPSHYLKTRVFVDACGYPAGPALRCALETMGADRLMTGSDWPSRPIEPARDAIRKLGLAAEAERKILRDNAARWFDPRRPRAPSRSRSTT